MNIDNKFWTIASVVIPFVALIVAIFILYSGREKKTVLEIKKINESELTRPFNVERLSSIYMYDDSIRVEHLWQTSYVIKNIGETTIYGEGFEDKNIRGNALKLHIKNCNNLLSVDITDTTTDAFLKSDDSLKFTQWRPNEYVELLILSDGESAPEITINDRDIQNAMIFNVTYSPEEQVLQPRLMDKLPEVFTQVCWWTTIIVYSILVIIIIKTGIEKVLQEQTKRGKTLAVISTLIFLIWVSLPLMWMF